MDDRKREQSHGGCGIEKNVALVDQYCGDEIDHKHAFGKDQRFFDAELAGNGRHVVFRQAENVEGDRDRNDEAELHDQQTCDACGVEIFVDMDQQEDAARKHPHDRDHRQFKIWNAAQVLDPEQIEFVEHRHESDGKVKKLHFQRKHEKAGATHYKSEHDEIKTQAFVIIYKAGKRRITAKQVVGRQGGAKGENINLRRKRIFHQQRKISEKRHRTQCNEEIVFRQVFVDLPEKCQCAGIDLQQR